jgi:GH35 family endo-1,4-beta-xylanase
VHTWDVVNEAVAWRSDLNAWGYREIDPWYPAMEDYIDRAFTYAREADPDAVLLYNDFAITTSSGKREFIVDMVSDMVTRGIPIDGVGL